MVAPSGASRLGGGGNASPFGQIMPCADLGPVWTGAPGNPSAVSALGGSIFSGTTWRQAARRPGSWVTPKTGRPRSTTSAAGKRLAEDLVDDVGEGAVAAFG